MKNQWMAVLVVLCVAAACNGNATQQHTDTHAPAADTMPVLRPQNIDSIAIMKTAPANDNNVVMPDSAIRNK